MSKLVLNNGFSGSTFSNKDILSVFKQHHEKSMTIQQGMSVKEISDVVSEKIMALIKEQFEATKRKHQTSVSQKKK